MWIGIEVEVEGSVDALIFICMENLRKAAGQPVSWPRLKHESGTATRQFSKFFVHSNKTNKAIKEWETNFCKIITYNLFLRKNNFTFLFMWYKILFFLYAQSYKFDV